METLWCFGKRLDVKPGDRFAFGIMDGKGVFIVRPEVTTYYLEISPEQLRKLAHALLSVADDLEGKL